MKQIIVLFFLAYTLFACNNEDKFSVDSPLVPKSENFTPLNDTPTRLVHSQKVYVPIYSSIYTHLKKLTHLSAILSIRNISEKDMIVISQVDYYDTNGKLLKKFIDKPFSLQKMSSKDFIIPESDLSGGSGANFVVKWETEKKVSAPIIESVMIGILGTQGFAFTSRAKEIEASF
ncbi:MAG TPA: DUF3124 domain-containing protein [Oligoflexia bacterium]|nr:DUF3124 domain-containing protein [Oligoflexia bacterium]HMR24639.1 DUF3124 domain-containing protein [Oligoflexia bacterium]